jgi:taurine dioxygenase
MHDDYADLPDAMKMQLAGMSITYDFTNFWNKMQHEKGSRPPLTDAQREAKPPVK